MLYILIIMSAYSDNSVATAEINGEQNCLYAAAQVNNYKPEGFKSGRFHAICVPRGR